MANLSIIRDLCSQRNLTLKELSKRINISEVGLQRIIKTNSTKIETLEKIAATLDTPIEDFFNTKPTDPFDFINDETIRFFSRRYKSFFDMINLYRDYYVWLVIKEIKNGHIPKYPKSNHTDTPAFLVTNDQFESIVIFDETKCNMPFNQWDVRSRTFIETTLILDGFYFTIFKNNFMNINEYLEDGMIKDKEILQYWNDWKAIESK